jgi:hypothetical protein
MSILKNLSTYEKMLEKPEFQKSTSGQIKQPMPGAADLHGVSNKNIPDVVKENKTDSSSRLEDVSAEDQNYLAAIDKRMAAKKSHPRATGGGTHGVVNESQYKLLEQRIIELEETVAIMMKAQMKLIAGD